MKIWNRSNGTIPLSTGCTLRIESDLLEKFHYVSRMNGRSANMQILIYIQKTVERYESDNGPIQPQGIKYTPSKKLPGEKR